MLQPYIRLTGRSEVDAALKRLARNVSTLGLKRSMLDFGRAILNEYIRCVPVDTGLSKAYLQRGVMSKGENFVILWIGPAVQSPKNRQGKRPFDYLHFPDHGTRTIKAQRFAGKAFRRGKDHAIPIIERVIKREITP